MHTKYLESFTPRPAASHVVFDFDGTLSLLRQGWPSTMLAMFLEILAPQDGTERSALETELTTEILSFNGRQPIHQMRAFTARVHSRMGQAQSPEEYLAEYATRLRIGINARIQSIRDNTAEPDAFVLHGARALLERLRDAGFTLYLLSGTNEDFVREESELLGLTDFFAAGLYGGTPDPKDFSKERIYDQIMKEAGITGENLLSFGDGPIELRATVERGGLSIAVASDETNNGGGRIDSDKQAVLTEAGAAAVIPDYRHAAELMDRILDR